MLHIAIRPAKVALAQMHGRARWGQFGRHTEADLGRHGVAQPVPVRDDDRQARRHRLDGSEAEGFLHVVDGKEEHVGGGEGGLPRLRVAAIGQVIAAGGHEPCRALFEDALPVRDAELAAEDEVEPALPRVCQPGLGLFHGKKQREGVEFLIRRQAGDGAGDHIFGRDAQAGAQPLPCRGIAGEVVAMDPQRDHREEWPGGQDCAGEAAGQVVLGQFHQTAHGGLHGGGSADHRVPRHLRRRTQVEEALHHRPGRDRMGDPAERPGRTAIGRTAPTFGGPDRGGVADDLDRADRGGLVQPHGAQGPRHPGGAGHGGKGGMVGRGMREADEFLNLGMGEEAAQETFPGDAAAVDALCGGVIAIGGEPDRGIGPGHFRSIQSQGVGRARHSHSRSRRSRSESVSAQSGRRSGRRLRSIRVI